MLCAWLLSFCCSLWGGLLRDDVCGFSVMLGDLLSCGLRMMNFVLYVCLCAGVVLFKWDFVFKVVARFPCGFWRYERWCVSPCSSFRVFISSVGFAEF